MKSKQSRFLLVIQYVFTIHSSRAPRRAYSRVGDRMFFGMQDFDFA